MLTRLTPSAKLLANAVIAASCVGSWLCVTTEVLEVLLHLYFHIVPCEVGA